MNIDQIDARIRLNEFWKDLRRAYPAAANHPELAEHPLRENADRLAPLSMTAAIHELGGLIDTAIERRRKRDARTAELAVYDSFSPGPGGSVDEMLDAAENTMSLRG